MSREVEEPFVDRESETVVQKDSVIEEIVLWMRGKTRLQVILVIIGIILFDAARDEIVYDDVEDCDILPSQVYPDSEQTFWRLTDGKVKCPEGRDENLATGKGVARGDNGEIYKGGFVSGRLQGYGKMSWTAGRRGMFHHKFKGNYYRGERRKGDEYTDGRLEHSGEWNDIEPHGQGTAFDEDGIKRTGVWVKGELKEIGVKYEFEDPDYKSPDAMYVRAVRFETDGQLMQALILYRQIIETKPKSEAALRAAERLLQIKNDLAVDRLPPNLHLDK